MNDPSTEIGGSGRWFPPTRWTAIRDAADPASPTRLGSRDQLMAAYWRPVYAYLRRKWGNTNEDAKDLTQEFFLTLCEKDFLERLTPDRGRFRAYLMTALDNFTRLRHRYETRQKRGGGVAILSLDVGDGFEPAFGDSPEQVFLREWTRSILQDALREMEEEFRETGHERSYRVFEAYDLEPNRNVGYEDLAARFEMSLVDVKNLLYRARVKLREKVLRRVRDTVSTDEEVAVEMRELFGESDL